MHTDLLLCARRRVLLLMFAVLLALSATYIPLLLDQTAGIALTSHVFACQATGGGC